jgi:hypothetical protein
LWQVKQQSTGTAVIEFSDGAYYEFSGTFEASGIGASWQTRAGKRDRAIEAFAV